MKHRLRPPMGWIPLTVTTDKRTCPFYAHTALSATEVLLLLAHFNGTVSHRIYKEFKRELNTLYFSSL